jgi:hypothetical protein
MSKGKKQTGKEIDPAVRELQNVKKLLMLLLIKCGATSDEVNLAVGMGASEIRRAFPIKKIAKGVHVKSEKE